MPVKPRVVRIRNNSVPVDFILFITAVSLFSFSQSVVNTIFNNFLNEMFTITNFQRGILEIPRELPGFLVVFVSAIFFFLSGRRLAALAFLLASCGSVLLGLLSTGYGAMLGWLFIFSTGQHLFLPLNQAIGMEFAEEGRTGRRLGQQTGAMNLAAIAGSFLIFVGFNYLSFSFATSYIIAAAGFFAGSLCMFFMSRDDPSPASSKLTLRREYGLFYWLSILFGTRKQIFLTFAPWVLVTVFEQKTQMVATLLTAGGVAGIFFNPLLGRAIDRFGERAILVGEAMVLVFVCLGYGFSRQIFGPAGALAVACGCFMADQLLMSVGMARATYLRKIAVRPEDVSQTLTMGVTIDHVFSIAIALVSGVIWLKLGYQYVFLLGALIALVNMVSASRVKIPEAPSVKR